MFPLDPGREYRVVSIRPGVARRRTMSARAIRATVVPCRRHTRIRRPSCRRSIRRGDRVPANQLRLYIHFSAPMGRKGGLDYITLVDAKGRDRRRSVPAARRRVLERRSHALYRVLRSRPSEARHPAESADGTLARARAALHARRRSRVARRQRAAAEEEFRQELHRRPEPTSGRSTSRTGASTAPRPARATPLVVTFPEPLDHGLLLRALGVARCATAVPRRRGERRRGETRWRFTPRDPWRAGTLSARRARDARGSGRQPHRPRVRSRSVRSRGLVTERSPSGPTIPLHRSTSKGTVPLDFVIALTSREVRAAPSQLSKSAARSFPDWPAASSPASCRRAICCASRYGAAASDRRRERVRVKTPRARPAPRSSVSASSTSAVSKTSGATVMYGPQPPSRACPFAIVVERAVALRCGRRIGRPFEAEHDRRGIEHRLDARARAATRRLSSIASTTPVPGRAAAASDRRAAAVASAVPYVVGDPRLCDVSSCHEPSAF